jgi:molecular chaperone GrpE
VNDRPDTTAEEPEAVEAEQPVEPTEAEQLQAEASALEQDIGELQEKARERDEYLALAQRAQADFENYRKRVAKDVAAAEDKGMARLARELLPALDNLARALEAEQLDPEGLALVQSEFAAALGRVGIEAYSPQGEPFDPNLHEAMAKQPVQGAKSGTVAEVYQPGYRMNGVVLRPARVVVAE